MLKTNLLQHIFIDALPAKVWKVLTSPHYLTQYLFEGDFDCQWTEGSALRATATANDHWAHQGNVIRVITGTFLKYSLQNYGTGELHCSFQLTPSAGGVELQFECDGCSHSGEEHLMRIQQIKLLLQKIKWLSEYA